MQTQTATKCCKCNKRDARPDRKTCHACMEYLKERRRKATENDMCRDCLKRQRVPWRRHCDECLEASRARERRRVDENRMRRIARSEPVKSVESHRFSGSEWFLTFDRDSSPTAWSVEQ